LENLQMNKKHVIFQGNVNLYLQGDSALLPLVLEDSQMISVIGAEDTDIVLRDYRKKPIQAAKKLREGFQNINFAKAFNQPGWAEVRYDGYNECLEIDIYEDRSPVKFPILWMGVIENGLLPAYKVMWEVYKPLPNNRTAFAALIP
jgi:hypothetical protein